MLMIERINGLVTAERPSGDSDKYLTVLTPKGKIDVYANHARSYNSRFLNTACVGVYNEFQLYKKSSLYIVKDITPIEAFMDIRRDLQRQSLALFFSEFATRLTIYDQPDNDMLRLMLNMLYALSKPDKPIVQIKAAFELKAMSIEGFMPALSQCSVCGKVPRDGAYLDVMNGIIKCPDCFADSALDGGTRNYEDVGTARIIKPLHPAVLAAMNYIIRSDMRKLLSFSLEDRLMDELDSVCECYMLNHIDHRFETFEFYKAVSK